MPNEIPLVIVALVATYLLHSTIALVGAWILLAVGRNRSAALQERVWKVAAIAPLLTAPLQFVGAEQLNTTAVWTLPAAPFPALLEPPATTKQRPPTPLAVSPPDVAPPSTPDSLPPPADDIARIEIIPDAAPTSDDPLPLIVPATEDLASVPVLVEPAPLSEPAHVPAAVVDVPTAVVDDLPRIEPAAATTLMTATELPVVAPSGDWRLRMSLAFSAVTLLGVICVGWRAAAGRWRLRSTQTITDGALRSRLDRLLNERGVRQQVRLAYSSSANEPAAGGVWRWVIIVPPDLETRLSPAEQHALLAHELAHLVRRDPLWLWIGTALCWCLPFQPLNFLAVRRWRQPAEELCDDWAVAGGVKPLTLASCLTRVAEWRLAPMPVGLTADDGESRFARRISRLVNHEAARDPWSRRSRQRLLFAGALVCALLLTCCGPRMQADSGEPGSVSSRITPDASRLAVAKPQATSAGPGKAQDAPVDEASFDGTPGDIAALLTDLERLDALIGDTTNDPELESARAALRSRIKTLSKRAPP